MRHLIVPFAAACSEAGRQAASTLSLPQLERLLTRCSIGERFGSDEHSWSTPHELAVANALGWQAGDGPLPWAAHAAAADGIDVGTGAWGLLTPVHLHLGTEQVSLADPATLQLDEAASRELFAIVRPLFDSEGFTMHWGAPLRWYAGHASLATLPTASLDRVIGRHIDAWLPDAPSARLIRRLQSEAQMLLYGHAFNERREAADLPVVNSFWLSGCGVARPVTGSTPEVDDRLRSSALAEDWAGWCDAWRSLDAGPLVRLQDEPIGTQLTLAGERFAVTCTRSAVPWWRRWRQTAAAGVLEAL